MQSDQKSKKVGKFSNEIVEKHLLRFEKRLSSNQQRLMFYLLIQEQNGESLQGVSWNELYDILNISGGGSYSKLRKQKFVQEMTSIKLFKYVNEENMESRVVFPDFTLEDNKLVYEINKNVKDLFKQPAIKYYLMNFDYIKHFKHDYSMLIYQLLNKDLNANEITVKNLTYKIDDLKDYLGLKHEYKDAKDFRKRLLEPSLREISEYTDIRVDGEYNKKTKKVQLSSKVWGKEIIFIGGVSRRITTQEYMDQKASEYVSLQRQNQTKVKKINKSKTKYVEPDYEKADTSEVDHLTKVEQQDIIREVFVANESNKDKGFEENQQTELQLDVGEERIVDEVDNNISDELCNAIVSIYGYFFAGINTKEDVIKKISAREKEYGYTLSNEEKIVLYERARKVIGSEKS